MFYTTINPIKHIPNSETMPRITLMSFRTNRCWRFVECHKSVTFRPARLNQEYIISDLDFKKIDQNLNDSLFLYDRENATIMHVASPILIERPIYLTSTRT